MKKWSFKKRVILIVAPKILYWWLSFTYWTCKIEWVGKEYIEDLEQKEQNWIFALWHMNIAICSYPMKTFKPVAIASTSFDGELGARILDHFHFTTARGSTSEHGARAMSKMIKLLKTGRNGAITPDGPRGPAYEVGAGTILIAKKTGLPILPCHIMSTKAKIFEKSWDQHMFPKLFGHVVVHLGKPIYIPENLAKEETAQAALDLKKQLDQNKADCEKVIEKLQQPKLNHSTEKEIK